VSNKCQITPAECRLRAYGGAYELGLTQINASGHNDPTAETLAQTIVMLAKHGERDPVRLKQRAFEIMSGHDRSP
jgi:hypothetical protein